MEAANRRILVVDDDPRIGRLTGKLLSKMFLGANVFVSPSGPAGLEVVRQHRPHVIILDHVMPEMDGKEFLRDLRTDTWGRDIPVLVMSGYDLDVLYREEPKVEFLRKPPRRGAIEDALVKLLVQILGGKPVYECTEEFLALRESLGEKLFVERTPSRRSLNLLGRWRKR